MGLDDFTSGDAEPSESNTQSTSTSTTNNTTKDNSPSYAAQAFTDEPNVYPRTIKYHIKTHGVRWATSFSSLRFNYGEKVMYGGGERVKYSGETVMVFTTIQPVTSQEPPQENQDIWVVLWDLEKSDNINEGTYVSPEGEWKSELVDVIRQHLNDLNERQEDGEDEEE